MKYLFERRYLCRRPGGFQREGRRGFLAFDRQLVTGLGVFPVARFREADPLHMVLGRAE